jgi:hypothetical protein
LKAFFCYIPDLVRNTSDPAPGRKRDSVTIAAAAAKCKEV